MSDDTQDVSREFAPPVSAFTGPVAELIAQGMVSPPTRPGLLATLDQFEILRLIGGGGMGIVLLARDAAHGRDVAIKMVKAELVNNPSMVYRFLKEAGHLKRLRHPNVVSVEAISERPEGPYFVMPYFEKGSLAGRIKPGEPLDTEVARDIAEQVAAGLSFAHRNGIIHRDLKPANILLTAEGRACLADFGLARTLFNDTITEVGNRNLEGTAPYMSPAVAAGDAEDTRCDIYSFGALLYEMLTGRPPYQGGGTKEILAQIIAGPPRSVTSLNPDADRGLVAVVEDCMARELRDRYADMRDVVSDLQRIAAHQKPRGRRGGKGAVGPRLSWPRVRRVLWLVGKMASVVALACLLWITWRMIQWDKATLGSPVTGKPVVSAPRVTVPAVTAPPITAPVAPKPVVVKPVVVGPPVWNVAVLAGQGGVGGYLDATGMTARFQLPNAVAMDTAGSLYVADTANHAIRKISAGGVVTTLAGRGGSHGNADGSGLEARFWAPFGIAVDAAGTVYVADTANNTIREISPGGVVCTLAGFADHAGNADGTGSEARFRNPWGVAVDGEGDVLVADMSNDTIRRITPGGEVTTLAGKAGVAGSTDGTGDEARFNSPYAVATDAEGDIYVADSGNNCLRKITSDGMVSTLAGLPGYAGSADGSGDNARFWNPQGLAVDAEGNIYMADTGNHAIRKVTPAGDVTTLAGQADASGAIDGVGQAARFNSPGGLAVDHLGNVYVADTGNDTIRKLFFGPKTP